MGQLKELFNFFMEGFVLIIIIVAWIIVRVSELLSGSLSGKEV